MRSEELDKGSSFLKKTGEEYAKIFAKNALRKMKERPDLVLLIDKLSEKKGDGKSLMEIIFLQRERYLEDQNCSLIPASSFDELRDVFLRYDDEVKKNEKKFYKTLIKKDYPPNLIKLYSILDERYEDFKKKIILKKH